MAGAPRVGGSGAPPDDRLPKHGRAATWTCAPYQTDWKPAFGQQVAWGESNAIVFANSVLGARTERYPDLLDICCAITGAGARSGPPPDRKPGGRVLFPLVDVPIAVQEDDSFYPVLGHLLGKIAQDRIPVIDGLAGNAHGGSTKGSGRSDGEFGRSGALSRGWRHARSADPRRSHARPGATTHHSLSPMTQPASGAAGIDPGSATAGPTLDMVVLGSRTSRWPSFASWRPCWQARRRSPQAMQFLVTSSRAMVLLAEKGQAAWQPLRAFGGKITVDTCILASPMLPTNVKLITTNSAKYAYYAPGLPAPGSPLAAWQTVWRRRWGRVVRDETLWLNHLRSPVAPGQSPWRARRTVASW